MKSTINSILLVFNFMKKYWLGMVFVIIFIILTTVLRVLTPQLIGEAIDELVVYVGTNIAYEEQQNSTLSEETIYLMWENGLLTDQEYNQFDSLTDQEKEMFITTTNFQNEVIALDEEAIASGEGYTQEQVDYILESDLSQEEKYVLTNQDATELQNYYLVKEEYKITEEDINESLKKFLQVIVVFIIINIILSITQYFYTRFMAVIAGKTTRDIRNGLFGKIEDLSIGFFDRNKDGDLLSKFANDMDNISNALNQSFVQVFSQVVMLIVVVFVMFRNDDSVIVIGEFTINNVLTWSLIIFGAIAIILSIFIIKAASYHVTRQQEKLGNLNSYIDERITSQQVIITNGLEEDTLNNFDPYNQDYRDTSIKGLSYSSTLMPMIQGIGLINLGVLIFLGSVFVVQGYITIGLLVAFLQYSQRFFQPLSQIVSQYNMIQLGITGSSRVKDVFEEEPEILNSDNPKKMPKLENKIELKDVSFGYNQDLVLKNIDIELHKGEMVALVGPTGSGKTTIMNLLNRFYDINSGEILIEGVNIKDIELSQLRKSIGIVLQDSVLFTGTIFENIAYGKNNATKEEVYFAAKQANIHSYIMSLDDKYDTIISSNASIFSVGQKQLLSIARTILTNPELLILDEATSNVDTVTEEKIQLAMENVMENRTSFVIAHRLKTIINADKIIVLKDGEILEFGNHKELLDKDGFYTELYNNQFVN